MPLSCPIPVLHGRFACSSIDTEDGEVGPLIGLHRNSRGRNASCNIDAGTAKRAIPVKDEHRHVLRLASPKTRVGPADADPTAYVLRDYSFLMRPSNAGIVIAGFARIASTTTCAYRSRICDFVGLNWVYPSPPVIM